MTDPNAEPIVLTPEPAAEPIVLTPEQRTALGKVYQLILGWRRQRLEREAEAADARSFFGTVLGDGKMSGNTHCQGRLGSLEFHRH